MRQCRECGSGDDHLCRAKSEHGAAHHPQALRTNLEADDANDFLYALAASYDYDPGPGLEKIEAPLLAVNTADDLINPPELGILEREISRVPHGRAVVIPFSDRTRGHGSHTVAVLWKQYLEELLRSPQR